MRRWRSFNAVPGHLASLLNILDRGGGLMGSTGSIYISAFERLGQKALQCLVDRDPRQHAWRWYRDQGYPVVSTGDIERLPLRLVEERVSRLRREWRPWIWGESVCSWILGPAGILIGGPMLAFVLMAWSVEMGWAYGQNMHNDEQMEHLRRVIPSRLLQAFGVPEHSLPLTQWTRFIGTLVCWGFGPEVHAADVVMAKMRSEFRYMWESRGLQSPFTV